MINKGENVKLWIGDQEVTGSNAGVLDDVTELSRVARQVVEVVRKGCDALLSLGVCFHQPIRAITPRPGLARYERIQQRIVERGGRRQKHNGRLGKSVKAR